jgi:hypothetical protein
MRPTPDGYNLAPDVAGVTLSLWTIFSILHGVLPGAMIEFARSLWPVYSQAARPWRSRSLFLCDIMAQTPPGDSPTPNGGGQSYKSGTVRAQSQTLPHRVHRRHKPRHGFDASGSWRWPRSGGRARHPSTAKSILCEVGCPRHDILGWWRLRYLHPSSERQSALKNARRDAGHG